MDRLITRKELEKIYQENGANNAARVLGCSKPTLYKLLRQADIKLQSPRKKAFKPDYRIKIVQE